MIQLLIAILLGLACPSDSNYVQDNTVITTNNTEESGGEEDGDGTGGTSTGTGTGGVGGNTGQIPPPPIVGG